MKANLCHAAHALGLAAALLGLSASAQAQAAYTLTVLNGLNGAGSNIALAINDAGAVVGATTTLDPVTHLYTRSGWLLLPGATMSLGFAPPTGYSATVLNGINNNGVVAGFNFNINVESPHGNSVFTWSRSTGVQALTTPASAYSSYVSGLNDAGRSVGYIESAPLAYSAVAWDAAGNASALPATPTGAAQFGTYINNNGQMLVSGIDGTTTRDYLWDSHTGYTALANAPGFSQNAGLAMNDAGHAVGYATDDLLSFGGHAVLWSTPGHAIDLGVLPGDIASLAYSINSSDMVVGTSGGASSAPGHGFLWSASTGMVDVLSLLDSHDPLLGHISGVGAYDINDAGQIVGSLYLDGVKKAFVLTPVPEPASWALLLVGICGLMGLQVRVRKHRGDEAFCVK